MKTGLLYIIFICFVISTHAQTDSLSINKISAMSIDELLSLKVNVGATVPKKIFDTPSSVSIIDRATIDRYNFLTVAEAIQSIAGIDMLQTAQERNRPTVRGILQNFYANKVLILINNTPTWQPIYGDGVIDRIDINDIERIEVLKGPASVLYGTNAYTGVINLVLRQTKRTRVFSRINAGIPNHGAAGVNVNIHRGDFQFMISANSSFEAREPYVYAASADSTQIGDDLFLYGQDTLLLMREEYRHYSLNFRASYKAHSLYINNFSKAFSYPGGKISLASGWGTSFADRGTLVAYKYDKIFNGKNALLANVHYDYHWRDYPFSANSDVSTHYTAYRIAGNVKYNRRFSEKLKAELGLEVANGRSKGHYILSTRLDTVISKNLRENNGILEGSAFAQLYYSKNWFQALGGMRLTFNPTFGSNLSSRASLLFRLNKKSTIKLIYGESFRTPNLLELYFNHITVQGNDALEPETSQSFEIIYQTNFGQFLFLLNGYYTKYNNLIQRIKETPEQPATYRNLHAFNGLGLEIEMKYENPTWGSFVLNYNYMNGISNDAYSNLGEFLGIVFNQNAPIGEDAYSNFRFIPKHSIFTGISKRWRNVSFSVNARAYSETEGLLGIIPTQTKLDAHIGYKHRMEGRMKFSHTLSFKNITDSDMLTPEYIRKRTDINALPTTAFGKRLIYTLNFTF